MNALLRVAGVLLVFSCAGRATEDSSPGADAFAGSPATGGSMALSGGASPTGTGGMVGAASGGTEPGAAGSNGGVGATAAGDANAPGGNVGVVSPEDCPGQPGAEPLSEPTCSATVQRCSVDEAIPDSCAFSPLSVTIAKIAKECGIYCGFLSVGAQSGCIAGLNLTSFGTRTGRTREAAEACMTQRLVGTLGLRTV